MRFIGTCHGFKLCSLGITQARCDGKISLEEQRLLKETEEQDRTKIQVVEKYPNAWDFTSTNTSYFSSIIWYIPDSRLACCGLSKDKQFLAVLYWHRFYLPIE